MTEKPDLDVLLAYWKKLRRCEDIDIVILYRRLRDLGPGSTGRSWYTRERNSGVIWIMDPIDADPDWAGPYDVEQTMVHELEHIILQREGITAKLQDDHDGFEPYIDRLADVLVALNRGQRPQETAHEVVSPCASAT